MKIKECCTVESQECIAKGIYSMWISTKVIAKEAKAGQFISLFSKDGSRDRPGGRKTSDCLPCGRCRNGGVFASESGG